MAAKKATRQKRFEEKSKNATAVSRTCRAAAGALGKIFRGVELVSFFHRPVPAKALIYLLLCKCYTSPRETLWQHFMSRTYPTSSISACGSERAKTANPLLRKLSRSLNVTFLLALN